MDQATFTISNVPIFAVGQWNGDVYNEADLDHMVAAFGSVGFKPPLKLGHDESQPLGKSDGMPALGWVANLRRVGGQLLADLKHLPKQVYEAIRRKNYDRVSAEVYWDYEENGRKMPRVLKALALLGADVPAVTSLAALESLYDAVGKPFRRYDLPMGPMMGSYPSMATEAVRVMRKAKETVAYRAAGTDGLERCGACAFFMGLPDPTGAAQIIASCNLVEGEVASSWVCDLWEPREAFAALATDAVVKQYIIEKLGDEWCLKTHDGSKTLGCHPTEEAAKAQERAVQASKNAIDDQTPKTFTLSREVIAEACPSCAERMDYLNIRELKVTYDPATKTYAGFSRGMCDSFGASEGFRTRCMDSPVAGKVDDAGAFCNALKEFCFGTTKETTKTPPAKIAVHKDAAGGKGYAMKVEEMDGQFCVTKDGAKVKCFPTQEEAQAYLETEGGGGGKMSKELEARVAQLTKDLEASHKRETDLQGQVATVGGQVKELSEKLGTTEQRATAAEAEQAKLAEEGRKAAKEAWMKSLSVEGSARILPVEAPIVSHLYDVLSGANGGTDLKVYEADGKKVPTLDAFKSIFECRKPGTVMFEELSQGKATEQGGAPSGTESSLSMSEARTVATSRAKKYMKEKGEKDFKVAYAVVLESDPALKEMAAGVTQEGAAKDEAGAAHMGIYFRK